ncbi:phage tail protein [Chryseobacterium gleum]|uniref:phage tail protein n=1 Tax=Chryseobacterium gleum TaxID=250 RepID=UPI001E470056|nr:phage tail protein [Chryseobacterium gleum]MCE4064364.1 phage tail protein [Chryseobacterium gleum]
MSNITLYRNGSPLFNLIERGKRSVESATLNRVMLSDDSVSIKLNSREKLDILINDYFVLFDSVYRINTLPSLVKNSNTSYEYNITAQGLMFDMQRCKYFNADATGFGPDLEFPLIGTIEVFLLVVKNNMKRFSANWELGNFVNGETKTITFGDDTCLSAMQKICNEFKTDFWIKYENGKYVIHTGDYGKKVPLKFEYGKGKGLYSLSRNNVDDNDIVNRLYVFGGTNNIPNEYRNFSKRLKLPGADYLEDQSSIAGFGLKEGSITFDEIYPHRTGKITSLGDTKFKFSDSGMDFDLNEKEADGVTTKYLIAGTSAKVHFNTGNLAGYEFEIKKGGYNHSTKSFEIIPFKNDQGQSFPDEASTAFQFAVGDEYVLLDIIMPKTYIDNAENELLQKGLEQFELNKNAKVSYDLNVDPAYMEKIGVGKFDIGDYIRVYDPVLGIDKVLRVNQITNSFIESYDYNPFRLKIVIADSYEIAYSSKVELQIKEIKNVLSITNLGQINYSKLGLKTTEELKNLVFDTDDYFNPENIRPNSIETNMISVGARSQQISCSVVFYVMYENDKNKIKVNPGIIYSQTFDKEWNIPENVETIPDDQFRYVYGKCSKTDQTGSIVFTQEQIKFDADANDYYFLIGILHSVVENVRVLSITVGTTTINGGLIRTGIISSLDGQMTINLDTQEIKGKIKFTDGSDGFTSIDNGLLMSQVIEVGNNTERNAFISSVTDAGPESIRFGAGADYAHKNDAVFKVLHNGKLIAENADIKGVVYATSGTFTGTVYAQAGKFGDTSGTTYFSISSKGLESINGWVAVGDFSGSGNDKKYAQLVADSSGSAILSIVNAKSDGVFHTGISVDVRNGTGGNVALDIANGDIRVLGNTGITTGVVFKDGLGNNKQMVFINGILTAVG